MESVIVWSRPSWEGTPAGAPKAPSRPAPWARSPEGVAALSPRPGRNNGTEGRGSLDSFAVGIEASTAAGTGSAIMCTVSTGVCAGSSSKVTKEGIGASHVIVTAGIDARSAAGTASTVVCSGASPPSLW